LARAGHTIIEWTRPVTFVEVPGDHAYALSCYSENLINGSGGVFLTVWAVSSYSCHVIPWTLA
jgi:hypothetical protein